jgi:hypothetical protein
MRGKKVHITVGRLVYEGTVLSASNWGTESEPNWYIEFSDERDGQYRYYKQQFDKGEVKFMEHPEAKSEAPEFPED